MNVEQWIAIVGFILTVLQGINIWISLRTKLEIATVKLWAEQRFVSKSDWLETLGFWVKDRNHYQRET